MCNYKLISFTYENIEYPAENIEFDTIKDLTELKKSFKKEYSLNGHPVFAKYKELKHEEEKISINKS